MKYANNVSADKEHHYLSFGFCFLFLLFVIFVQSFDAVIEAFEKGQAVDLRGLPSSPGKGEECCKEIMFSRGRKSQSGPKYSHKNSCWLSKEVHD